MTSEEKKAPAREAIRIWTTGDFDAPEKRSTPPTTSTTNTTTLATLRISTAPRR